MKGELGTVVLAGSVKIAKQLRRGRRRLALHRLIRPNLWAADRGRIEASFSSRINRDDYIVGENKALLYLHPDLRSNKNINFLKRVLYFAGKTGDRVYRKNKKELVHYLSREGISPITLVYEVMRNTEGVDPEKLIIVGEKRQIENELSRAGFSGACVIEQGRSVGGNLLRGKRALARKGYGGEHFLVIGGDVPLVTPEGVRAFLASARGREGSADMIFGMGSRQELREYIIEHRVEDLGRVGPNYPKKGNLNKFGIPLVDDLGIWGEKGKRHNLMMGNLFLYRTDAVDMDMINRLYSMRKMGANPLIYPRLLCNYGVPLFRSIRWKLPVSEAERIFSGISGLDLKVAYAPPEIALDLDSYSDLRRISAVYFTRKNVTSDLELDFRRYIREKKRSRSKKKHKIKKSAGKS